MANDRVDRTERAENQIGHHASGTGPDFGSYIGDINKLPRISSSGHEATLGNLTISMGGESSIGSGASRVGGGSSGESGLGSGVSRVMGGPAPEVQLRDPYHVNTDPYEGTNDENSHEHQQQIFGFPT